MNRVRIPSLALAAALILGAAVGVWGGPDGDAPAGMVAVPSGNTCPDPLVPGDKGRPVDAFFIDRTEVTFKAYDAFCDASGRTRPGDEGWGRGSRPVINIDWSDADAYCRFKGKRLPTEDEWERAAAGPDCLPFPWGASPDRTRMNYSGRWCDEEIADMKTWRLDFLTKYFASEHAGIFTFKDKYREGGPLWPSAPRTLPVGTLKNKSAYGALDMAGNVAEWTADWEAGKGSAERGSDERHGTLKIVKGGSWRDAGADCGALTRRFVDPGRWSNDLGCRCAQ